MFVGQWKWVWDIRVTVCLSHLFSQSVSLRCIGHMMEMEGGEQSTKRKEYQRHHTRLD